MTPEEQAKLHKALFARLLREVEDGSMDTAQKAMDMMQGETAAQTLAELMGRDN